MQTYKLVDLFLIRHGIAIEASSSLKDSMRPMSHEGILKTTAMLQTLATAGFITEKLFSSPYLKAHQTAEIAVHVDMAKK